VDLCGACHGEGVVPLTDVEYQSAMYDATMGIKGQPN
jgi:hypothetical protein